MADRIDRRGSLAARFDYPLSGAARLVTKWHLVDSEVSDRIVTFCGREMKLKTRSGNIDFATEKDDTDTAMCSLCDAVA